MGLDMHLEARRHEHMLSAEERERYPELADRKFLAAEEEAVYWRKTNAVHKWFVDNVQQGVDDCGQYPVSRQQLRDLRDTVIDALAERDSSLLPPTEGFFFGGTDVDTVYWQQLGFTAKEISRVLESYDANWEFCYRSSW